VSAFAKYETGINSFPVRWPKTNPWQIRLPHVASRRAPVQVIEGNYQRMAGICPWWDEARGKAR